MSVDLMDKIIELRQQISVTSALLKYDHLNLVNRLLKMENDIEILYKEAFKNRSEATIKDVLSRVPPPALDNGNTDQIISS